MCETSTTTKPVVVAQLVNEMRALIQEMKTVIEAKDPKTQSPELQQARETEEFRSPHFWGDFSHWATTDLTQKGNYRDPPCPLRQAGIWYKTEKKIDPH